MDTLNAATLEYAKTRQQFGGHRALPGAAAPHGRDVHPCRAVALDHAAGRCAFRGGDPEERRRYVSAAKARRAGSPLGGQEAVQIHGGMGVTDELPAAHMFKRHADQHDVRRCRSPSGPLRQPAWFQLPRYA
jgi:alkylation response protein AidB-like acyl-CoA dehydrogenase